MMRSEMKTLAKKRLKGKWVTAIAVMVIGSLIVWFTSVVTFGLGALVVAGPLALGETIFFLNICNKKRAELGNLFEGFRNFFASFILLLLQGLFIFLWSLLFIIPGIIKMYSYGMAFYILSDNPGISGNEALKRSKKMMNGHKWELFVLQLSFFGWFLLTLPTFGLISFYVGPYMRETIAVFYQNLAHGCKEDISVEVSGDLEDYDSDDTELIEDNVIDFGNEERRNRQQGIFLGMSGSFSGISYTLPDGAEYCVGRDAAQCEIVVSDADPSVSRLHCMICYTGYQDGYYVTDYSSNGTYIDGVKIIKGQKQFVNRGTVVSLGNQMNSFKLD